MKIDTTGREIRRLARERGYLVEMETVTATDGEVMCFWWFLNGRGQPLVNGAGAGLQDQDALNFLQGTKP